MSISTEKWIAITKSKVIRPSMICPSKIAKLPGTRNITNIIFGVVEFDVAEVHKDCQNDG
jgi:hypothetical protein